MSRPISTWHLFFAGVLISWAALFVLTFDMAASGAVQELGPGMGWMDSLVLALAGQYQAICLALGNAVALHSSWWLVFAMWALMAIAMMAPTAVPLLRTYRDFTHANAEEAPESGFWLMLAGYLNVWLLFAGAASLLQQYLSSVTLLSVHGVSESTLLSSALFFVAGLYQFTDLKQACLTRCRTPLAYFISHWQRGPQGAFRMGLHHGLVCVGCCWALMLLAFVGGTMNLVWMGVAMTLMIVEKLSLGRHITIPLGISLIAAAGALAAPLFTTS